MTNTSKSSKKTVPATAAAANSEFADIFSPGSQQRRAGRRPAKEDPGHRCRADRRMDRGLETGIQPISR